MLKNAIVRVGALKTTAGKNISIQAVLVLYVKKAKATENNMKLTLRKPTRAQLSANFAPIGIFALLVSIVLLCMWAFQIRLTTSGSMPTGFYQKISNNNSLSRHDIIEFCLPTDIAQHGLARRYLNRGSCPGGTSHLLKEVIAVPGDLVIVNNDYINVNGTNYKAPITIINRAGQHVMRWIQNGTYIANGYWVYGANSPMYSWDSRYYGQIPANLINAKMRAVWIF